MNRMIDEEIDKAAPVIERAITKQIEAAINALDTNDTATAIDANSFREAYDEFYKAAALRAAGAVYNAIVRDQKDFTEEQFLSWEASVNTYLAEVGGAKIKIIDDYTKRWVRGVVTKVAQEAAEQGLGSRETAALIRNRVATRWGEISETRALRIAQTEVNAAANWGAKAGATEAGMTRKFWISAMDPPRVRPEHLALNGAEPIGIDELFNVGGSLMDRPSDPNGSPGQVINCRCQMGFLP